MLGKFATGVRTTHIAERSTRTPTRPPAKRCITAFSMHSVFPGVICGLCWKKVSIYYTKKRRGASTTPRSGKNTTRSSAPHTSRHLNAGAGNSGERSWTASQRNIHPRRGASP